MSRFDDQLADSRPQTFSSGAGIHIWGDQNLGTIWIATRTETPQRDEDQRFVCIEVAGSGAGDPIMPYISDNEPRTTPSCCRLSLNIAASLLEKAGTCGCIDIVSTRVITDPIVFELALAIMEVYSLPHISGYTRDCMVNMLCTQISGAASAASTSQRRQGMGFERWQRQRLDAALSKLGDLEISLELFANRCKLSVCHFARLFKVTYGMPFHQYVVQRQISRACALLSETQESISQIALGCGFSDQSSFTRRFSAETGMPPAAWRKSLLSQPSGPSLSTSPYQNEETRFASYGRN